MHLADRIAGRRRGDDRPHAPARHAECLRRAADGDGAVAHPLERRDRDVLALVIDVLVDLVGHGVGVVPPAELGNGLELAPCEHAPGRVVRGAHDDGPRPARERRRDPIQVQLGIHRHGEVHRLGAAQDRVGSVVLVERLEHDHFVARIDDGQQRRRHRLGGAARHRDLGFGIHGQAIPVGVLAGERVAQPLGAPGDRVLVHVVRDGARGGFLQDLGGGKIREPLRQVDGSVLAGEPGHAADHRFGEPVGAPGGVHAGELTTRKAPARLPGPSSLRTL